MKSGLLKSKYGELSRLPKPYCDMEPRTIDKACLSVYTVKQSDLWLAFHSCRGTDGRVGQQKPHRGTGKERVCRLCRRESVDGGRGTVYSGF